MKNTKLTIALLLVLVALTLCACHATSPDTAETTPPPADTTPAETTPAETTPAEIKAEAYQGSDFEPGVILLGLKEPHKGDISLLFPELDIAEIQDVNLKWYEQIKDLPDSEKEIEYAKSKIGTDFIITLTDTSAEAVLSGIAAIKGNSLIAYVSPNYIMTPHK